MLSDSEVCVPSFLLDCLAGGRGGGAHPAAFPRSLGVNIRSPANHLCPVYTTNYCPCDIGHSHASARGPPPPQRVPLSPHWAISPQERQNEWQRYGMDGYNVAQCCKCIWYHCTVHLEMVKIVHFMSCVLYRNAKEYSTKCIRMVSYNLSSAGGTGKELSLLSRTQCLPLGSVLLAAPLKAALGLIRHPAPAPLGIAEEPRWRHPAQGRQSRARKRQAN